MKRKRPKYPVSDSFTYGMCDSCKKLHMRNFDENGNLLCDGTYSREQLMEMVKEIDDAEKGTIQ